MSEQPERRSIRLAGYDYAQGGVYFVTLCTQGRAMFFADERVKEIAEQRWLAIPEHSVMADLDEWVVMPNHVHGLIVIGGRVCNLTHSFAAAARLSSQREAGCCPSASGPAAVPAREARRLAQVRQPSARNASCHAARPAAFRRCPGWLRSGAIGSRRRRTSVRTARSIGRAALLARRCYQTALAATACFHAWQRPPPSTRRRPDLPDASAAKGCFPCGSGMG
jgi:hypothetical protein